MNIKHASTSKLLLILTVLALFFSYVEMRCEKNTAEFIDEHFTVQCKPCPENCEVCYLSGGNEPICAFCGEGKYMNSDQQCLNCHENCSHCVGSDLDQCYILKTGFFINKKKSIEKCSEECSHCHNKQSCLGCADGYYASKKTVNEKKGTEMECSSCGIDNCHMCEKKKDQVSNNEYLACTYCEKGFAVVSGKCEACPENCKYCREDTLECTYCDSGHFINKNSNKCEKLTVDNCYNMDGHGKCLFCESHFYLDNGLCKPCLQKQENCTYCKTKGEDFECLSCKTGFYKDKEGHCRSCPENCNHCSAERCYSCKKGMFYNADTKQCENCNIENCNSCSSSTVCMSCETGHYYDGEKKNCQPCDEKCLTCVEHADNCLRCPVTDYTLHEAHKQNKTTKPNILNMIFGSFLPMIHVATTEFKITRHCVKKCPKTHDGVKVVVNEGSRRCLVETDEDAHDIDMPVLKHSNSIFENLTKMKVQYDSDVQKAKEKYMTTPDSSKSDACNYKGVLKKKERGNYDSYFFCRCDEGYTGDNCQLAKSLIEKYQNQLVDMLNDIETSFTNNDNRTRKLFLDSLLLVNKFKSNLAIIKKNLEIVKNYLRHDKNTENRRQLYNIYDALLLNLFDLMDDLKRLSLDEYEAESDVKIQNDAIYSTINEVVQAVEDSFEDLKFSHSFLSYDMKHFIAQDTYSYIIAEYRLKKYNKDKGFYVVNPNIDMSTYVNFAGNKVFIKFKKDFEQSESPLNLQLIVFSASLFEDKITYYNNVLVSNLMYMRPIDPNFPHLHMSVDGAGLESVRIKFALLFVPIFDEVEKHVFCKAYNFEKNDIVEGTLVSFIDAGEDEENSNNAFVICEFHTHFDYRSHYFGIAMNKV